MIKRASYTDIALLALLSAATLAVACSASSPSGEDFENGSSTGSGGHGGATSGAGPSTSDGDFTGPTVTSGAGGAGGGNVCAAKSVSATPIPLTMMVMFDRSGSMKKSNKWINATAAFEAFFADASAAGISPALRFFPTDGDGCEKNVCDVGACKQPLVLPAPLTADPAPKDAQEKKLIDALMTVGTTDSGGTPLYAALDGAEEWAADFAVKNPKKKIIVVLVTDGDPNGCDEKISHISGLAKDALTQHGIVTYAVGLFGSSQSTMDQIAWQGGSGKAFMIGLGNAEADLLKAMKTIQGASIACTFTMPKSSTPIDPTEVNVVYTDGKKMADHPIGNVKSKADCKNVKDGWYYDDPKKPTKITLCSQTCATVQADSGAKVDIEVGCATMPAQPN